MNDNNETIGFMTENTLTAGHTFYNNKLKSIAKTKNVSLLSMKQEIVDNDNNVLYIIERKLSLVDTYEIKVIDDSKLSIEFVLYSIYEQVEDSQND